MLFHCSSWCTVSDMGGAGDVSGGGGTGGHGRNTRQIERDGDRIMRALIMRALITSAMLVVSAACGVSTDGSGVEPIPGTAPAGDRSAGPGRTSLPHPAQPAAPTGDSDAATDDGAPSPGDDSEARAAVTEVLAAYGRVLSQMSTDPAGAPPPGSPLRSEWDAVVVQGSVLSEELLDRTTRRAVQERMVIEPDPAGVSFLHRPVELLGVGPDEVSFTWCGWSPGIGRSVDTGEVVDDAIGHATGTGRIVAEDGGWSLEALDQEDLRLLAPGSADPCIGSQVPR